MPPAGYPAFLQYLQSGRVSKNETALTRPPGQRPRSEPIFSSTGCELKGIGLAHP